MSEVIFRFPLLGFTSDLEIWGFQNMDQLTKCGPRTLKEGIQIGMELIDADLRRWKVVSVRRTGRAGSIWSLLLPFGPPQSRIEHDLEPMEAISIDELRLKVCSALERHAEDYFQGDERETEFEPLLSSARSAGSVSEIYDLLQPDTFEPH